MNTILSRMSLFIALMAVFGNSGPAWGETPRRGQGDIVEVVPRDVVGHVQQAEAHIKWHWTCIGAYLYGWKLDFENTHRHRSIVVVLSVPDRFNPHKTVQRRFVMGPCTFQTIGVFRQPGAGAVRIVSAEFVDGDARGLEADPEDVAGKVVGSVRPFQAYAPLQVWGPWVNVASHGGPVTFTITARPIGNAPVVGEVRFQGPNGVVVRQFRGSITITTGNSWATVRVRFKSTSVTGTAVHGSIR